MTLENYCRAVYKYTFARALSSAFYAAHVIVRLKKNPFEDGAEEHYDSTYGKLFRECPGLKGVILVGESIGFPSRDPHVCSGNDIIISRTFFGGIKMADNFIHEIIEKDLENQKYGDKVYTRFPPEPNGYLHIGHAKSICLNFSTAAKYGGKCNLRYDDTNPVKEDVEYVDSIEADVRWLGFEWDERLWASDYFDTMYEAAVELIKQGKAFVCDLTGEEIREYRGTLTSPGKESPYRNRTIEENLQLFEEMKAGKYADGEKVLRAKIDMASPNINMRDPIIYRIAHATHHNTGDKWCITLSKTPSKESHIPSARWNSKTTDRFMTGFSEKWAGGHSLLSRLNLQD